jgi:hypothetical protein
MPQQRQDMPSQIPDCSVPKTIQAERIRLWRLFDHIADCRCDADIYMDKEPHALPVLRDWANDRMRGIDVIQHPPSDNAPAFTVYKCNTGLGVITIFSEMPT